MTHFRPRNSSLLPVQFIQLGKKQTQADGVGAQMGNTRMCSAHTCGGRRSRAHSLLSLSLHSLVEPGPPVQIWPGWLTSKLKALSSVAPPTFPHPSLPPSPVLELQDCAIVPGFYAKARDPNSSFHSYHFMV